MFRSLFYILNFAILTINVIIPYYIFPLGYMYFFLTNEDENNEFIGDSFSSMFVFIIMFLHSIMNIFYPLLCHTLPYQNYKFS